MYSHLQMRAGNNKITEALKCSPDLLNNVKIGQGQLIIETYFVLPYEGGSHFGQVT